MSGSDEDIRKNGHQGRSTVVLVIEMRGSSLIAVQYFSQITHLSRRLAHQVCLIDTLYARADQFRRYKRYSYLTSPYFVINPVGVIKNETKHYCF